jgi:class 3 adenylate cyclase
VDLTEGERHQATIVFSDLSGYTSMNEKLDPEQVEAIMSRIKMEAVRIVESHEGIVNQFVGDEVLALFGIPTAHEDDPVRAVKAAFEIHELVRKISLEVEERIDTKLRMHTKSVRYFLLKPILFSVVILSKYARGKKKHLMILSRDSESNILT